MKRYCTIITIALLSCLFIYIVYRSEKTVINIVLDYISGHRAPAIRRMVRHHFLLPDWVIYCLPEGLWVFSATLISRHLYCFPGRAKFYLSWLPVIYAVLLEFLQLLHIMPGRFDWTDLFISVLFSLWATYFIRCPLPQQHVFRSFNYRTIFLVYIYAIVMLSHVHVT